MENNATTPAAQTATPPAATPAAPPDAMPAAPPAATPAAPPATPPATPPAATLDYLSKEEAERVLKRNEELKRKNEELEAYKSEKEKQERKQAIESMRQEFQSILDLKETEKIFTSESLTHDQMARELSYIEHQERKKRETANSTNGRSESKKDRVEEFLSRGKK